MTTRCGVLAGGAVLSVLLLSGCSLWGGSKSACEVFSPATVSMPSTQNDQRVATTATGVSSDSGNKQQDCN